MQKNNFFCDVCKINVQSAAEYALHEFSKKHCSNLMRIAKNKKVTKKEKLKVSEESPVTEEPKQLIVATAPGSIAKYGYFVPGKIYETGVESKEFNTEYDPYIQKYAEYPSKESRQVPLVRPIETLEAGITGSKKKKKKLRTCQICNVMLLTVPEYEAHMKSPQHVLNLKTSGMGVSAHFVKASTDLHTVKTEEKSNEQSESLESLRKGVVGTPSSGIFPMLYCDVCELLLNSEQQFNAHVNGKSHNDNVQRKAEVKAKKQLLESPSPNQLYCFSCKVALNNLYQYNEHKYGKKHQMKCKRLMRLGITIPPEERVASWGTPKLDPNMKVVYPELYEKFILERDKNAESRGKRENTYENTNSDSVKNLVDEKWDELSSSEHQSESNKEHVEVGSDKIIQSESEYLPRTMIHEEGTTADVVCNNKISSGGKEKFIIGANDVLKCSICGLDFTQQKDFDHHLSSEDHARKIVEVKGKGMKVDEILNILLNDKNAVKPDKFGRYSCSTCSITAGNDEEFAHHISTVVHKQSEEDYKRKRNIEVKFAVKPDENGKFTCIVCQENNESLVEYNRHLHTSKHREGMRAEKARKIMKISLLKRVKQKYIISGLKRKDFACWRKKCEENPGVRTKTSAPAVDLHSGNMESIPDSEELRTKIETIVSTGTFNQGTKRKNDDQGNLAKEMKRTKPNVQESFFKPSMPRPYSPRPSSHLPLRHSRPMFHRNWVSYPQQPFRPSLYPQRPIFPVNRYQRPPNFHPSWPRYPPCYN